MFTTLPPLSLYTLDEAPFEREPRHRPIRSPASTWQLAISSRSSTTVPAKYGLTGEYSRIRTTPAFIAAPAA